MLEMQNNDTICALSTPLGEGGISIVRLTGRAAFSIADKVIRLKNKKRVSDLPSHTIHYGHIVRGSTIIDEVMVSLFRAPKSYTREDMVEINTHGGMVLTREVLDYLIAIGARMAEPGEFTKRAFLNGRIDLTQAEAVIDIIKAKSELSVKSAVEQLGGRFSQDIESMKERLLKVYAHVEAFIDFPDDEAELYSNIALLQELSDFTAHFERLIETYKNGAVIRDGVHTVLVGRPNVGKSSLLNVLLNRDRALVSEYAGTTRDAIEELIEIEGVLFRIVDTAGIMQNPQHQLDFLSIEKTKQHYESGDLILLLLDASEGVTLEDESIISLLKGKECIIVGNKIDKGNALDEKKITQLLGVSPHFYYVSVLTKEGVGSLEKGLIDFVWKGKKNESEFILTRVRHKNALEAAAGLLERARQGLIEHAAIELIAYDLKEALQTIKELIGEVYSADVLNRIFEEFCIGK